MRILCKDGADGMLLVSEVVSCGYAPENNELWFAAPIGFSDVSVPNVSRINADYIIQNLYRDGTADLTLYAAQIGDPS